jgi:hypothetical protein
VTFRGTAFGHIYDMRLHIENVCIDFHRDIHNELGVRVCAPYRQDFVGGNRLVADHYNRFGIDCRATSDMVRSGYCICHDNHCLALYTGSTFSSFSLVGYKILIELNCLVVQTTLAFTYFIMFSGMADSSCIFKVFCVLAVFGVE